MAKAKKTSAHYAPRPLIMPDARAWSDLFLECAPWDSKNGRREWAEPWNAPDYLSFAKRPKMAPCPIGPYCSLSARNGARGSLAVKARPETYAAVKAHTIHIANDEMSFEVIVRKGGKRGECLVTCAHSRIIGSVWLAMIDPSTIPPEAWR